MQTEKPVSDKHCNVHVRQVLRGMSENEWIEKYGSTKVRKAKRLGAKFKQKYLKERVAFEFGFNWQMIPSSRVLFGDVNSDDESQHMTECLWLSDCYIAKNPFYDDIFEFKYLYITNQDDSETEGVGLICRQAANCSWIPDGQILYWIQAEYDKVKGEYKENINP